MEKRFIGTTTLLTSLLLVATLCSCGTKNSVSGVNPSIGITPTVDSYTETDLVPTGERLSYTIAESTYAGRQKLHKLSKQEAEQLALTEAADAWNCDRVLDPRFTTQTKGSRVLSVTVSGRPAVHRMKSQNVVQTGAPEHQQIAVQPQTDIQGRMVYHEVESGETLIKIAKTYKVSISDIVKWNSLSTTTLKPGMKLKIHFNN